MRRDSFAVSPGGSLTETLSYMDVFRLWHSATPGSVILVLENSLGEGMVFGTLEAESVTVASFKCDLQRFGEFQLLMSRDCFERVLEPDRAPAQQRPRQFLNNEGTSSATSIPSDPPRNRDPYASDTSSVNGPTLVATSTGSGPVVVNVMAPVASYIGNVSNGHTALAVASSTASSSGTGPSGVDHDNG